MTEIVLDASAILALLMEEPGAGKVAEALPEAIISAVNAAEVISKFADRDPSAQTIAFQAMAELGIGIVPFDADQAHLCGALRMATRAAGLSLGDRACLALAKSRSVPALTADRSWLKIADAAAVHVIAIRD